MLAEAGTPAAVVLPRCTEDVVAVMRIAHRHGVPVVPRGAGSGLAGASNAVDGAITLVMTRMDAVLEVSPADRLAVVRPGVVNKQLRDAVAAHGLFYPPDPSSYDWCTIGGNLSTNSGGLCCVKYGVTTDYVLGLEVVLADGRVLRTGRRHREGRGRLRPRPAVRGLGGHPRRHHRGHPRAAPGPAAAGHAGRDLRHHRADRPGRGAGGHGRPGAQPARGHGQHLHLRRRRPAPRRPRPRARTHCWSRSPTPVARPRSPRSRPWRRCAARPPPTSCTPPTTRPRATCCWPPGRMALPALEQLGSTLIDDVAVPRSAIATFLDGCDRDRRPPWAHHRRRRARRRRQHAPRRSCSTRPTPVSASGRSPPSTTILELGLSLGGTITGEHGVGSLKVDWLEREVGPVSMEVHRSIKDALDPSGLLNPGKVLRRTPDGRLTP